jgi:hypothetical protein
MATTSQIATHNSPEIEGLRPELLRRVLEHALPHGLTFSFEQFDKDDQLWELFASGGNGRGCPIVNRL